VAGDRFDMVLSDAQGATIGSCTAQFI
jgi:hypothetical protein